jgi:hypothetical protein
MEARDALPERGIEHGPFFVGFDLDVYRLKAYFVLQHGLPLHPFKGCSYTPEP